LILDVLRRTRVKAEEHPRASQPHAMALGKVSLHLVVPLLSERVERHTGATNPIHSGRLRNFCLPGRTFMGNFYEAQI
jgi:hypothetical protein